MIRFEEILEKVETYNPQTDEELLRRAYVFSAREHRGQVRRSGEPYLIHPLNVAAILTDMKADDVSIVVIWRQWSTRRKLVPVPAARPAPAPPSQKKKSGRR